MPTTRLLILSAPDIGVLPLLTDLTGSSPTPSLPSGSCAGLTHTWDVQTPYYSASIPIWIDEVPSPEEWKTEFSLPEAKEVVEAVGGWVYLFRLSGKEIGKEIGKAEIEDVEERLKAVKEVMEGHGIGEGGVMLAVFLPPRGDKAVVLLEEAVEEELDGVCIEYGFEFVQYAATGLNAFGEKRGFERVKEALEANEWTSSASEDEDDGLEFGGEDDGFGAEEAEMHAELFGMKASLLSASFDEEEVEEEGEAAGTLAADLAEDRQASQVEDLDVMMSKLLAVREQSAELPEAQRKKMAATAVREIMGDKG